MVRTASSLATSMNKRSGAEEKTPAMADELVEDFLARASRKAELRFLDDRPEQV